MKDIIMFAVLDKWERLFPVKGRDLLIFFGKEKAEQEAAKYNGIVKKVLISEIKDKTS